VLLALADGQSKSGEFDSAPLPAEWKP
jgi:hypothetical protein